MKKLGIGTILICLVLGTGCNLSTAGNRVSKTAYLSVQVHKPESANFGVQNRSAVPSLPQKEIFWKISLCNGTETKVFTPDNSTEEYKYSFAIEPGTWQVTAEGFDSSESRNNNINNQIIFRGIKSISINNNGYYDVTVYTFYVSDGVGTVDLSIDVSDSQIEKLVLGGTETGLDNTYFTDQNGIIRITRENIPAATYSPVLTFYENIGDSETPNYIQIISLQEKINVRQNVCTNQWIKSGATPYFRETENKYADFVLNKNTIVQLLNTSFYVASTDSTTTVNQSLVLPSDDNSGNCAAPFESLQGAFNKILALEKENPSSIPYRIYIDGIVTSQNCEISETAGVNIHILPYKNQAGRSTGKIISEANLICVGQNTSVKIEDLALQGEIQVEGNSKLIFSGETRLSNGCITLSTNTLLLLSNIKTDNLDLSTQDYIAKIKSINPVENHIVLEDEDGGMLSENIISLFRLNNPGFYLGYNDSGKGIIKTSVCKIKLPKIQPGTVRINASGNENANYSTETNSISINYPYENTIFQVSVFDDQDQEITDNLHMYLLCDGIKILESNSNPKSILIPENFNYPGKYLLYIQYALDNFLYDSSVLVNLL